MGNSRSAAELVAKLDRVATHVDRSRKDTTTAVAMLAKEQMIAGIGRSGVKPTTLLGGRKWSVGFDVKGTNKPTAMVRYRGPVHWIESGTRPHVIGAKLLGTRGSIAYHAGTGRGGFGPFLTTTTTRRGTRARKGKRALTIGSNLRAWAFHPGVRARPFWDVTRKIIEAKAPDEVRRQLRRQLTKVF